MKIWSVQVWIGDLYFRGDHTSENAAMNWLWDIVVTVKRHIKNYGQQTRVEVHETDLGRQ